jgi:hypothetical protein
MITSSNNQNTVNLRGMFDDSSNIFGSIVYKNGGLVRVGVRVSRVDTETVGDSFPFGLLFIIIDGERKDWWLLGRRFLSRNASNLHGESIVVKLKRFVV